MSQPQLEIQLVAMFAAVACAIPGVFLVLRRTAMLSDAIGHSVLLGIVAAFFLVRDITSPLLLVGAALVGVATVWLVESVSATRLVRADAAIALVFPLLFSIAVILISRYAGDVHLDTDAVLLGELAFVPFDRLIVAGWDLGPRAAWSMGAICIVNVVLVTLLFKELKVATFDAALAAAVGIAPALVHYGLVTVVSVTAVGAFDAVGSILVVALMIVPAATAYLLTDRLSSMLLLSAAIAAMAAFSGFWLAHAADASIAGATASVLGVLLAAALVAAPERGLVARARARERGRWEFAQRMLAIHLLNHESDVDAEVENSVDHLHHGLRWDPAFTSEVLTRAQHARLVRREGTRLQLTSEGRDVARSSLML